MDIRKPPPRVTQPSPPKAIQPPPKAAQPSPLTVRTGGIRRLWLPLIPRPRPPADEERNDARMLAQTAELCARSYEHEGADFFTSGVGIGYASQRRRFDRTKGRFFWRPLSLILPAYNYLAILAFFVLLLVPLLLVVPLIETIVELCLGVWISFWPLVFKYLFYALLFLTAAFGLFIGAWTAIRPELASARAPPPHCLEIL